jgi:hypothetical protein
MIATSIAGSLWILAAAVGLVFVVWNIVAEEDDWED